MTTLLCDLLQRPTIAVPVAEAIGHDEQDDGDRQGDKQLRNIHYNRTNRLLHTRESKPRAQAARGRHRLIEGARDRLDLRWREVFYHGVVCGQRVHGGF